MPHRVFLILPVTVGSLMAATGCHEGPDERLAEAARQSVEQQSRQNEQMARHNQQLTEAARQLVEADARARQEMIDAQHTQQQAVQAERASLDRQHEELEQERRQIAQHRHRDPILAAAITSAALLLACLLPLLLALYVLCQRSTDAEDAEALSELLVYELTAEEPQLLPGPRDGSPQLEHHVNGQRGELDDSQPDPSGA